MLSILNTLCHGYVAIPVLQACRRQGMPADWRVGEGVRFSTAIRTSGANEGYLRITLSMLESLGWISRADDIYQLDREIDFDTIPKDILDLYRIAPERILTDTLVQLKLSGWLVELRNKRFASGELGRLLEGALLLPVLIALRTAAVPGLLSFPETLDKDLGRELRHLFAEKGWGHEQGNEFHFSDPGRELLERAYVMAIALSYRPMLARVEELLFGNADAVFARDKSVEETHVDRQMNVIASGFQHQRYFKDAEHHLLTIFNDVPLAEQPSYIADIGCGDGTLLRTLYEAISSKTVRGQNLTRYPLRVIGVDYNQAALIETEKTLKGIPHLTFAGDIGDPRQIVSDLRKNGIADPENTLYLRSFLDHNFQYKTASRGAQESGEPPLIPGSHYVDGNGQEASGPQVLNAWRAHLERWAEIPNRHGLMVLESHCLPPSLNQRYFDRTESFYFDAVHALSGQYLIEAEVFIVLAAAAGLFPKDPPLRYPKTLPFCRITLSHFEKRDYIVRHAQAKDLDALLDMEEQCWASELRTSRSEIRRRLETYPQGQFVLELDGRVAGVIYSQRIESEQVLKGSSVDVVGRFHRANGPIVQLLALNVLPVLQGRKLGDELLNFMLQRCSVMNGVEGVVGITVCKDHALKKSGPGFLDYVRARDEHGLLLDSNLRFHEFHGATIGEVVDGYRPKDVKNETRGVFIRYDIYNLRRRTRLGPDGATAEPTRSPRLEIDGDVRQIVEVSIKRCLGELKTSGFMPDRPLMEMGLDSADLLELNELLSRRFNISLEPAFFFEHNTYSRIVGYLESRFVGRSHPVAVITGDGSRVGVDRRMGHDDVAIVGVSARLPGRVSTLEEFWSLLKSGRSAVGTLPHGRWQWPNDIDPKGRHSGIDQGGFLERLDAFDAGFFRISPKEAELMDPQQRILMELAWQTVEDAGFSPQALAGTKTGVFVGASGSDYFRLLDNPSVPVDAYFGTGNSMAILANRLSYFFDFHGPSLQIDTACSSSLVALHYAIQSLRSGECSQALVGGVHLMCHPANTIAYYNAGMLSRDGTCKTFDGRADGYVRSEGAVMILLKPLKAAEADGDPIYAVIKGTAINHGGQAGGLTVPNPEKQAQLLETAWKDAGVSPSTLSYIEMHGTGTPLGDPIEVVGIRRAFARVESQQGSPCGLGSVKTNLGHLEAAAGLAGLLKVVLCLRHRELPATVHLREINRHIRLESSPLYVVREHQAWPPSPSCAHRRVGVSSFGFGGANAHAVLEEYPRRVISAAGAALGGDYLFVLSARTPDRLRDYAERYIHWLSAVEPETSMGDLTYTLQMGRQAMDSRLALVAKNRTDLIEKLKLFCSQSAGDYFQHTLESGTPGGARSNRNSGLEVETALDRGQLAALAKLWILGVTIPWSRLYRDGQPHRIQLPTYPFAPVSHWYTAISKTSDGVLHPLVHRNTSDRLQKQFTSTFNGSEFFFKDHVIGGRAILPGVAYLEMVCKACEIEAGSRIHAASGLAFRSVIWAQPIQVAEPTQVCVRLNTNEDRSIGYEIYSTLDASQVRTVLHGQGIVISKALGSAPKIDLAGLQKRANLRVSAGEFYARFRELNLNYGPALQGVGEVFLGSDQALARISLPSCVAATAADYVLHPSVVDSALQAGIALQMEGSPLLPFAVESIEVFAATKAVMWVWARYAQETGGNANETRSLDIDLCDESGNVCIRFRNLSVRRQQGDRAEPAPIMIKPVWTPYDPVVSRPSREKSGRALVFGGRGCINPVLKEMFPNSVFVEESDSVERLGGFGDIQHVVWLAADSSASSMLDQLVIDRQRTGVLRLFNLVKALVHQGSATREMVWTICTAATQAVEVGDRVDPAYAGIHGFVGSMAKEFPNWHIRLVDLGADWAACLSVLSDLPADTFGKPIAHRGGQWFRREFIPVERLSGSEALLKEKGVYVVVGGAGGIGHEWSRWLIERYRAQMIWIGRREKDSSIQRQIDELGSIGPAPFYISADATNRQSLQAAYDQIKARFTKINGVVHSAIVLKDSSLANMTLDHFKASLDANVDVCVRIAEVFNNETLDFVLFFSSIQSFCTFAGQGNYAAGCTFKDAFADRLRQEWPCAVKSVNWGYWGSVGVVASDYYRQSMEAKGFGSIEPEEGFELLEGLIDGPIHQLAILKTLRIGVVEGVRQDESFTAAAVRGAAFEVTAGNWLPEIPALQAAATDGGLSLPELAPILGRVLWGTIQSLGFAGRDQAVVTAIKDAIDGSGRYARWIDQSLAILQRQNYLQLDGDTCLATDPTLLPMNEVWSEWNVYKDRYLSNPNTRAQVLLLDECLHSLPEILTGKVRATDVIFADSSTELVGGIYRNNRIADYFNDTVAGIVKAYIEERARADSSAKVRILEIGAGTGGTTAALLSILEPLRRRIEEYCFTDISSAFLDGAHEQFDSHWPGLVTRRFDVEASLTGQSIPLAGYDVVVAGNALHATRDIRNTIRNAKAPLRKGGLLVLNELSSNSLFLHLTFGLLNGWWLFEDSVLRIPGCPGLYPDAWRSVLENEGFRSIAFPAQESHGFGQQIVVAQSDGVIRQHCSIPSTAAMPVEVKPSVPRTTSVFAGMVPDDMVETRVKAIVRESIAANLKMKEGEIQNGRVFSDYGVDSIIGVGLVNRINQCCNIAIPVTALFDYSNVNELSAFITRQFGPSLISSLFEGPAASDVTATQATESTTGETSYQHVLLRKPGQIRDVEIIRTAVPPLGSNEVRLAVYACSLNFADVLCVKGLYPNMPPYPFTPGLEASGVITEVGASVRNVAVGEAGVVFLGKSLGGHATVITCSEEHVLKKPETLSFEEACSVPAVGVTMVYAFRKARLQRGESILIQTATGGTGLVAVQLAQHFGAEIYATAGSEEKLEYLRELGVPHTINYRQKDFAAEIKRLTQGRGVDVVINTLGGDAIQKGLNCLSRGGRYVEVAMTALRSAKAVDLSVLSNNQSFHSVDLARLASEERDTFTACYEETIDWVSRGVLRPTISHILPFDRIREAYEYLEDRRSIGKVVLSVPHTVKQEPAVPVRTASTARERHGGNRTVSVGREPIAVIGMSGRFSKSPSLKELWKHLANGADLVDRVRRWDLRRAYDEDFQEKENACYDGALLEDIDKFDASFFDISALEATHMDPQQRLFLEEAWKAIEDAGYAGLSAEGRSCGVYVGCTNGDYYRLLPKRSPAHSFWGNAGSVIPARIAYYLNLRGPAIALDTACSSSLVAMHMACEGLRTRETELALAGGVFVQSTVDFYLSANRAGMLSPNGRCHTFDERADGFVPGEGVGVLVLKRLDDAVKEGDHIYGVIRGSAINQDGKTNGITAPSGNSQQRLERRVYEGFSIHPDQIQMVEAHGTGTRLGDPIEFDALTQAFRQDTQRKRFCAIGSIKSNLGHAATAAGVAGVQKILLSLQHRQIPPSLHFESGNPAISFDDSPFYVNTKLKGWDVPAGEPRCAAVSSFGFSGTNAHMVIEEAPAGERSHGRKQAYLIVTSARNSAQLEQQVEQLADFCEQHPAVDLGNMSYTLLAGRKHLAHRFATVARDSRELIGYCRKWIETKHVLQVHITEVDEDKRLEDRSLKEFGNECIRICSRTIDSELYLTRLATIGTLFGQGYNLDFAELFAHDGYSRISLPTYPFSKERYWVEVQSHSRPSAALHPLLHENHSTFGAQLYRSEFTGDEFFLADHQLDGKRLMPAVAYLEMAIAAVRHALRADRFIPVRFKNVVWPSPLAVSGKAESIAIRLLPKSDTTIDFEITGDASRTAGHRRVHCQGSLDIRDFESASIVDVATLSRIGPTTKVVGARDCYAGFEKMGIAYGPAHRGLESVLVSGDRAVARISLPDTVASTAGEYGLHPSLMDAALQAALALLAPSAKLQLPYAVEEIRVHRPSERHMWAIVHSRNGIQDIDVCNEEGVPCVHLKGLTLRDVGREPRMKDRPASGDCLFFQPILRLKPAIPQAPEADYSQRWAVLCGFAAIEEDTARLQGTHVHFLRAGKADSVEQYFEACVVGIVDVVQRLLHDRATGRKLLQILISRQFYDSVGPSEMLSALSAVVRTIRQEAPAIITQLIQVEEAETAQLIVEKMAESSRHPEDDFIAYRNTGRHIAAWQELSSPAVQNVPWKEDGIYLIMGGAGGIGQIFLREIINRVPAAIIIVAGRSVSADTPLNEMEGLRTRLNVHYRQADVSNEDSVDALVEWIREEVGELTGVLHCAGTLRDGLALRKTREDVHEVLAPKVAGLMNLDRATRDFALDFFVCFSSVAGAFGNVGQMDYAAANAFTDAFAHYRAGLVAKGKRRGKSLSINWPLWKEGGIQIQDDTADRLLQRFGMTALSSAAGLKAFYACYGTGLPQVLVLHGDDDKIRQISRQGVERAIVATSPAPLALDESTVMASSKSLRDKATTYLRHVLASVLMSPVDRVKEADPFERFGIDSILALTLTNELEKTFGSLSKILFFEHRNIRSLADYLLENHRTRLIAAVGGGDDTRTLPGAEGAIPAYPALDRPPVSSQESGQIEKVPSTDTLEIAIVGLSGRYPGSRTINEFWENLKSGKDCISEIPSDRWDYHRYFNPDKSKSGSIYSKWGGFIEGVDEFDPLFFNITPRDAEIMDPQERLFLQCAYETIEDAGYVPSAVTDAIEPSMPANVGVFVGVMYEEYQLFGVEETVQGRPVALSGNPAAIANRVSYFCNFSGPCMVVDTMCSSSLTAIHLACQSIRLGECEVAIAGGVNVSIHPNKYLLLSQGRFASSGGRCESFGRGGDGYVPGEGVGAVLLKPLSAAIRDGDHIYGVIKGTALNHGGKTNGFTVPNPNAHAAMIGRAIKQAGVHPRDISYVEAHGTGTSLGDPIEIAGLTQAFREHTADRQYCAIGSLKSNIGHCESAAGIGGVTKVLVQLEHKQLVPSLHSRTLNPLIPFNDTPFRVQQELSDWLPPLTAVNGEFRKAPRIAGISSFGAGGSNAHIVIQECAKTPASKQAQSLVAQDVLIVLSAKTGERLMKVVSSLYEYVRGMNSETGRYVDLVELAYTLQVGRVAMEERVAFTAKSHRELEQKLQGLLNPGSNSDVFRADNRSPVVQPGRLGELAQMWVNGGDVDWNALYGASKPGRVSLPTYPFARERYWVPGRTVSSEAPAISSPTLHETVLTKDWKPGALPDKADNAAGVVVVLGTVSTSPLVTKLFADRPAVRVVEVLQASSSQTSTVSKDFYSSDDGESLYRRIRTLISTDRLLGLIDCTALDASYEQRSALEKGKLRFIQLLLESEARQGFKLLDVVLRLNPFRSESTTLQGARLAGLYRMIGAEYRRVQSFLADVDLDLSHVDELAPLIQREFLNHADDGQTECCYRRGIRYLPHLIEANPSEGLAGSVSTFTPIAPNDVFMVTGGTRGIGAAVAEHLVSRGARRLVLLGREKLPVRDEWKSLLSTDLPLALRRKLEFLLSLIDKQVQIRYFNTSLTDSSGLREMLLQIHRELGPICGVIHCAGLSGENPAFIKKAITEIESVCEPKVQGLIELDRALRNEPLRFFVCFSSVASAIPSLSAGQSDYAMANAFMDFYAAHQHSRGRRIFKSIQWPAWSETGMAVGKMETSSYKRTGLLPLTTTDGMRFLELTMNSESPVALPGVLKQAGFDYDDFLNTKFSGDPTSHREEKKNVASTVPAPAGPPSGSRRTQIVHWLRGVFMSELKLTAEQLRETRRFDEYGVESVMIAQLVQIMQNRVRGKLSPSLLLERTSVADLADYFLAAHADDFVDTEVPAADDPNPSGITVTDAPRRIVKAVPPRERGNPRSDIAIVGMACRFPGAPSQADYWRQLAAGHCAIHRIKDPRWESTDDRFVQGGWLDDVEYFDPSYFNLSAQDVAVMDPQARLLLEESLFALCDAGYDPKKIIGEKAGVYIGGRSQMPLDMSAVLKAPNPILGSGQNYLATNISRYFNFGGPSVVVDTGCSSAITGMVFASDALRSGRITMALVGGVSLLLTSDAHRLFAERKILSESGEFQIFDRRATGEVLGEGGGVVILKRLDDAIADGNPIYAVIKAIGMNNDGRTLGPGSPNIHAQRQVMTDALQSAGIGPEDVGYIEVNGGGSPVVDAVELKALSDVYRLDDRNLPSCFLGSVKPNVGHLLLASGLAGFIRCVLSVYHKKIPPFLSATEPFEYYDFSTSRIRFNRDAVDWQVAPGERRIAAQNSYPDGGTNVHVLVEEFVADNTYRRQLFAKPQPLLKRSRFPLSPVPPPRTSVAYVTRMTKEEVRGAGMIHFLDKFAATADESLEGTGLIRTAWGEYDEESI